MHTHTHIQARRRRKWDTAHVPNQDKLKNGTAINGEQRPALHSRTQTHPTLNLQITHVSGRTKIDGNPDKNVPKTRAYGISQRQVTTDRRLRVAQCAASAPRRAVRRRKPTAHTCLVPFGSAATPNDAATAMHALSAHVLAQQPVGATKGGPAHAMCGVAAAAAVYMRALEVHKGARMVWGANHTAQPQKIHQKRHRHKTIQVREKGGLCGEDAGHTAAVRDFKSAKCMVSCAVHQTHHGASRKQGGNGEKMRNIQRTRIKLRIPSNGILNQL